MRREINTADIAKEVTEEVDFTSGADGKRVMTDIDHINKAYIDELAFMEEEMVVMVHESADPNSEDPITVGCNGVFRQFFRGRPTRAKRKFIDCLIVKQGRVTTPEYVNGAGERARSIRQTSAHKYPFSVIEDRSHKGAEWLRGRLSEVA